MSRKRKLLLNTVIGMLKQIITMVCGFILPRYMLMYYGSATNGLVSSISHYLSFISLLDMGVGAVIQANLYKPLAQKDNQSISRIVRSSQRFFGRLAVIFLIYLGILSIVFPMLIESNFSIWYSISLLLIIAISTFTQYLFGMTYQLLLNADQKAFIPMSMSCITTIINTIFSIILMKIGTSIHVVKLVTTLVFILRPLGQMLYVNKHYKIDKIVELKGEPIKQKWNGFSQHMAAVICQNIDVVVLTCFSSLENVSVYSVYFLVTSGVQQMIMTAATGLESLFGNMVANKERVKLLQTFEIVEWVIHTCVLFVFTIAAITIVPFIRVYTREINDANYIVPVFGVLLVAAYAMQCLRVPYFRIIKAAGHFKETQNGAYISAALNIVITIALVFKFGLVGTAIGTFVAMTYHTCYFAWYLSKHILFRPLKHFIKYILSDIIVWFLSIFGSTLVSMTINNYLQWTVYSIYVAVATLVIIILIQVAFHKKELVSIASIIKNKIIRK